jgi:large subunit ribosomal protein L18
VRNLKTLSKRRQRRAWRVRKKMRGTEQRPRLSVHRTSKNVYAQIIDDASGRTLCSSSSLQLEMGYGGNVAAARAVGEALGKTALEMQIERVGFDRGPYRYHGRVKALADGLRAAGLKF